MEYWVAVSTPAFILIVELASKRIIPIEQDRPEYYGISWAPHSSDLVLSHSGLDNALLETSADYMLSEKGYISRGGKISSRKFLSCPHQILCVDERTIICTNTGRNSIALFDSETSIVRELRLSESNWDRISRDNAVGDHLNSVYLNDNILYVLAHGHKMGSSVATFSFPELAPVSNVRVTGRTGMHNIYVNNDGLCMSCDSNSSSLVDVSESKSLWESGTGGYIRGLAASEEVLIVGESRRTSRGLRTSSDSALWVIDVNSFRAIDYIYLGPFGAVNDVRLMNIPDLAHNRRVFLGLQDLLNNSIQDQRKESCLFLSEQARSNRNAWDNWDLVFGDQEFTPDGGRRAKDGSLCLIVLRHKVVNYSVRFKYFLAPDKESHVSFVLYSGDGMDTLMSAFLLSLSSPAESRMTLWYQTGVNWFVYPDFSVKGLPPNGELEVALSEGVLAFSVSGKPILDFPLSKLPIATGRIGLRWQAATVELVGSR